jgi:hypothetical protein
LRMTSSTEEDGSQLTGGTSRILGSGDSPGWVRVSGEASHSMSAERMESANAPCIKRGTGENLLYKKDIRHH